MSTKKWLNNQFKEKNPQKDEKNENQIGTDDIENEECYEMNLEKWIGKKIKKSNKKINKSSPKSNFIRESIGNKKYLIKNENSFMEPVKHTFLDLAKFYGTFEEEDLKNSKVLYPSKELENLINYIENKLRIILKNVEFQVLLNRSGVAVIISNSKFFGVTITPSEDIEHDYILNAWFRTKKNLSELFNTTNGFIIDPKCINNIREVSIKKIKERITTNDILDWFQKNIENIMN